jgi:hypothetical protein
VEYRGHKLLCQQNIGQANPFLSWKACEKFYDVIYIRKIQRHPEIFRMPLGFLIIIIGKTFKSHAYDIA